MMILPIIFFAGVIYFINQIIDLSSLFKGRQGNILELQPCRVVDNSLNILNERFARGEIREDEYIRIRSTLYNR